MNTASGQGRHQMFDGRDTNTVIVRNPSVQFRIRHAIPFGGNKRIAIFDIRPAKPYAILGRRRLDRDTHGAPCMQACSRKNGPRFDRRLQSFHPLTTPNCDLELPGKA